MIDAADVEKLLEDAPVVTAYNNNKLYWSTNNDDGDTHTARLVMMEPIAKDTAEGLLREIVSRWNPEATDSLIDRAKRLLEGK